MLDDVKRSHEFYLRVYLLTTKFDYTKKRNEHNNNFECNDAQ